MKENNEMADFDLSKITGREPPLVTDDERDAEIAYLSDVVANRDRELAALRARVAELEYVAGLMWDRYEDGEPCYEGMTDDDTGTYTGQAVYFSDEETARILAAIPEERLPGNKPASLPEGK